MPFSRFTSGQYKVGEIAEQSDHFLLGENRGNDRKSLFADKARPIQCGAASLDLIGAGRHVSIR